MIEIKFEKNKSVAYDSSLQIGVCEFTEKENIWNIIHTEVDDSYQGQGIARKLIECVIENAKENNKHVVADCSYAKNVIEKINNDV